MRLRLRSSAHTRRSAGRSGEPAPPLRSRAWRQTCASSEGPKCRATLSVMTTSARDLSARLAVLLRHEHGAMADFLVALAEFDRRRLWVELGYSSLFYFLHRELNRVTLCIPYYKPGRRRVFASCKSASLRGRRWTI